MPRLLRGKLQVLHATHLALGCWLKAAGLLPEQVGRRLLHLPLITRLWRARQGQRNLLPDLECHAAAILRHGQLLPGKPRWRRLPGWLLSLLTTTQAPHQQHQGAEPRKNTHRSISFASMPTRGQLMPLMLLPASVLVMIAVAKPRDAGHTDRWRGVLFLALPGDLVIIAAIFRRE